MAVKFVPNDDGRILVILNEKLLGNLNPENGYSLAIHEGPDRTIDTDDLVVIVNKSLAFRAETPRS